MNSHQYTNAWQSFVPQTEQQEQEEEVVSPQQSHVEKGSDEDLSRWIEFKYLELNINFFNT